MTDDITANITDETTAQELYELIHERNEQLDALASTEAFTIDEREHLLRAVEELDEVSSLLDERRMKEMLADVDLPHTADNLKAIHDLTGDIMTALGDVEGIIDHIGYPETNPYDVADEQGYIAKELSDDIMRFHDDSGDPEAVTDGGAKEIPLEKVEALGFGWSEPSLINSNGTDYAVGWDDHGWFTIAEIDAIYLPDEDEWHVETVTNVSFNRGNIQHLLGAIEEGL